MILKDIANIIKMDISTVSRIVSTKVIQTDFGIYQLKDFFSEGHITKNGENISNKKIKKLLIIALLCIFLLSIVSSKIRKSLPSS